MKFTISTAAYFYDSVDQDLINLGCVFKNLEEEARYRITIDTSKAAIEINTLEELINFIDKYGKIVLDKNHIIIYNDYLE